MATFDYVNAVLSLAQYVEMSDGSYYGEVTEIPGLECDGKTLEDCKRQLRGKIRDWVNGTQNAGELLPVVNGIDLNK